MVEETKAELYLAYLNRVLAGEEDIGPVEDVEVAELLQLAQIMIAADISVNSEIMNGIQKQLLERISLADHWVPAGALKDDKGLEDELTDEELQYAAAGLQRQDGDNICPRCGTMFNRLQGKCPACRY